MTFSDMLSLRREAILLPCVNHSQGEGRTLVWKPPVYNTIHHILTNPVYAGAYAFGRTGSRVTIENGRKRIVRGFRKDRAVWDVLLLDRHAAYISWPEFERNQRLIADNANGMGMNARGALRKGELVLAGLLRCGHCGRKLHVAYSGANGDTGRYHCRGAMINHGTAPCISFGSLRVDQAVGGEIVRLLQPLGVEAALHAISTRALDAGAKQRQVELSLEQARYEAVRTQRQYDAVDPDNRLVAGELERRWNAALIAVKEIEDELETLVRQRPEVLGDDERRRLLEMGSDLEAAWEHPAATAATRKRIIRAVLDEIVVRVEEDRIQLLLHWRCGDHTALSVRKNHTGRTRWAAAPATEDLIRALARQMPDKAIAALLNREGEKTGRLNGWTQSRVCAFRNQRGIAVYREGERAARGEVTLDEAADQLGCSAMTALRMIRDGALAGRQHCKGAPWIIDRKDVEGVKAEGQPLKRAKRPLSSDPDQTTINFQ